ncbi:hypothetical protein SAMN05444266_107407 [Chitinophaga jiangningensis]|uniref:Zinc-finger n=1 Tax=Chitinophaga jiangningensis TaxID=1419482 RepID=A0A1M7HWK8_9BACT|nr:hypothetical protein [Chitinophaga jiangningensis]SHM32779.1 hypothetical protein SAMN05444266_107407 [Chitinophaga jiangningensis]
MSIDINISNYESFLLSYIDNELSEEERSALEAFLQHHPAIRQELELLDSIRLEPDEEIVFDQKHSLYRGVESDEHIQSLLLDYIDGELDTAGQLELTTYLQEHPESANTLARFQAAKLDPSEQIVFPDRALLYRTTKTQVRRISPVWWGAAAAVVAGILVWMMPFNNAEHQPVKPVLAHVTPQTAPVPAPAPTVLDKNDDLVNSNTVTTPSAEKSTAKLQATVKSKIATVQQEAVPLTAASQVNKPDVAAVPLPPPRNVSQEIVEKQAATVTLPSVAANHPLVADKPVEKEPVIAANAAISSGTTASRPAPEIKGELIISVSGSDSKILDKVTNVAKFFSRKRNK